MKTTLASWMSTTFFPDKGRDVKNWVEKDQYSVPLSLRVDRLIGEKITTDIWRKNTWIVCTDQNLPKLFDNRKYFSCSLLTFQKGNRSLSQQTFCWSFSSIRQQPKLFRHSLTGLALTLPSQFPFFSRK